MPATTSRVGAPKSSPRLGQKDSPSQIGGYWKRCFWSHISSFASQALRPPVRGKRWRAWQPDLADSLTKNLAVREGPILISATEAINKPSSATVAKESIDEPKRSYDGLDFRHYGGGRHSTDRGCTSVRRDQPGFGSDSRAAESARRSIYQPGLKRSHGMLY